MSIYAAPCNIQVSRDDHIKATRLQSEAFVSKKRVERELVIVPCPDGVAILRGTVCSPGAIDSIDVDYGKWLVCRSPCSSLLWCSNI